ncbi:methyltransferase [Bifidobacterium sp. DSM 109963]|uniref:Methyltransferase n=1 Tax=Bifidobacterium panos TaxID=2675321 RepID=A0ABX1SZI8_9BIFI|nr:methyltransferase [Bifidobacterium sp. DSM 109963]
MARHGTSENVNKVTFERSGVAWVKWVWLATMKIGDDTRTTATATTYDHDDHADHGDHDTARITNADLPLAERDSAHLPGHWLLARIGKRVLRPGGLKLSLSMLAHARLSGCDVVEFAPGLGRTAAEIVKAQPKSYVGVDRDPQAKAIVQKVVASMSGRCINADAAATGLAGACADVVVCEAMLTMQTERGKDAIVSEAARLLRSGGRYAIHELGLRPDELPEDKKTEISRDLARAIKVNARPLTVAEWKTLLEHHGFEVVWSGTAPMALLDMQRNLADEGINGALRILRNIVRDKGVRQRVLTMKRTFNKYADELCGVSLIARKR